MVVLNLTMVIATIFTVRCDHYPNEYAQKPGLRVLHYYSVHSVFQKYQISVLRREALGGPRYLRVCLDHT